MENSENNSLVAYQLQKAFLEENDIIFENSQCFARAMQEGIFLLKIPSWIDMKPGIKLCQNFYKEKNKSEDDEYRGFRAIDSVYYDPKTLQVEHIMLDKAQIDQYLPPAAANLAVQINQLAINVLKLIFNKINIPENYWENVTGGAIANKGKHWLVCNHYRSGISGEGFSAHQDTGFITVLYIEDAGLEARINHTWYGINPEAGYFIINFGAAIEILTHRLPVPAKAVLHRVKKIVNLSNKPDRFSMASFIDLPQDSNLYQYEANGEIKFYKSVRDFLLYR